ncbi:hypothetical protein FQR65_LT11793 [Abscondita terminalis]|nr:hypothetical protein FQR65_LT11793 [Abscondita terminalis]
MRFCTLSAIILVSLVTVKGSVDYRLVKNVTQTGSEDVRFICSNTGIFPDPENCTKYHICVKFKSSFTHFEELCKGNGNGRKYGFNPEKLACSDQLSDDQCQNNYIPECKNISDKGIILHTSIYYHCNYYKKENGDVDKNLLYPYQKRCDNGKIYNTTAGKCT